MVLSNWEEKRHKGRITAVMVSKNVKICKLFIIVIAFLLANSAIAYGAERDRLAFNGPGYRIEVPQSWVWQERGHLAERFVEGERMTLDVYTQPLKGKSPEEYINYSNKYVREGVAGIRLLRHTRLNSIEEFVWVRPSTGHGDQNYYREINLIRPGVVYTFICKTQEQSSDACGQSIDRVARSLSALPLNTAPLSDQGVPIDAPRATDTPAPDINSLFRRGTSAYGGLKVSFPDEGLVWGIFDGNAPFSLEPLKKREEQYGKKLDLVMTYRDFSSPFPFREVLNAAREGRLTMVTWQPWYLNRLTDPVMIPEIVAGKHDAYIRIWASLVRDTQVPVLLRFANEMNGDWDPWSVYFFGFDHDLYIKAWRRVHSIFLAEGATNAIWVWNPHDRSYPDFTWNDPHLYYPGDQYVDIIGLTGYNTGPRAGDPWRSFDEIYAAIYDQYRGLYPGKPMMITEFASDEHGGDKAAWIKDTFEALKRYPGIRMAVWFDFPWWQWEYPLNSSPKAEAAFWESLADPYFKNETVRWNRQ